jgi:hypothetical protein
MSIIENNKDLKRDYSSTIGSKKERNQYKNVSTRTFRQKAEFFGRTGCQSFFDSIESLLQKT